MEETPEPVKSVQELPETAAQTPDLPDQSNEKSSKKLWLIIGLIILAVLIAAGAYFVFGNKSDTKSTNGNQPNQQSSKQSQDLPATQTSSQTTHYKSDVKGLDLSFDYPANWSVTTTSDAKDVAIKYITVSSPAVSLQSASGKQTAAKIVVVIRPTGSDLSDIVPATNTVAQDSSQIAYTNPTKNQRKYPYLSFVFFGEKLNANNPFNEVIMTGANQFKTGDIIVAGRISEVDPLVSASFTACDNAQCTGKTSPLLISNNTWQNDASLKQVQALMQSLQIN